MQETSVVLVAPAAFKGTLGPRQVADAISAGARRALPGAAVLQCPISDGGDGLLDAVLPPGSLREHLRVRSEEHTSELQSQSNLVCRLLLEKKKPHILLACVFRSD